jgi:hypothetical protein
MSASWMAVKKLSGGAVVLLRVEPAGREARVPRERQLTLGRRTGRERQHGRDGDDEEQQQRG